MAGRGYLARGRGNLFRAFRQVLDEGIHRADHQQPDQVGKRRHDHQESPRTDEDIFIPETGKTVDHLVDVLSHDQAPQDKPARAMAMVAAVIVHHGAQYGKILFSVHGLFMPPSGGLPVAQQLVEFSGQPAGLNLLGQIHAHLILFR